MITLWEVIVALLIGIILASGSVFVMKKRNSYLKEEYAKWWTPTKYRITFVIFMIVEMMIVLFGWFY